MEIIKLGKELNIEVKPHWSEKDVYYFDISNLQVLWYDKHDGGYAYGWQIADKDGTLLYNGLDNNKVKEIIKKYNTVYKILIKYPSEYKTPLRIEERDDRLDANDLLDEVEQGFGSCLIFNEEEYKEFLRLAIDELIHIKP